MRLVRDRADARWLPVRYRYAIFRLIAYAAFRVLGPTPARGIVLALDRDQSALESYAIAVWLTLTSSCFAIVILEQFLPSAVAFLVGPIAAIVSLQIITSAAAVAGWPEGSSAEVISFLTMLLITAVALYVAGSSTWARSVAWAFLASLALNALASVLARLMRSQLEATEREIGVT